MEYFKMVALRAYHAPTFLAYTGSKPRILHGMGE